MRLVLVTGPSVEPVDLTAAKAHLRVDHVDEDDEIEGFITAAREHVENVTRRALLTQTWDYSIPGWPTCNYIRLPFGNLQSVTSVKWKDSDGTETTLTANTDYLVEINGDQCGRIVLPYATPWPSGALYPSNPITIRFVCGWIAAALIPPTILAGIKLVCAKLYEGRGEDTVGQTVMEDKTVGRLLASAILRDEF